jgi:hypothetical protein
VNCPEDQYMVVKIASYRGLLGTKSCGSNDDYSCEVDVTCVVKKQCDGSHECSFAVDDNLFSSDLCPGLSNYLYFEYQCVDSVKNFKEPCGKYIWVNMTGHRDKSMQFTNGFDFCLRVARDQLVLRSIRTLVQTSGNYEVICFLYEYKKDCRDTEF